jgi:hypothetical protein
MKLKLPRLTTLSLLLVVLSGCQSEKFTHYTSPEVTGRVLAADTHQPIANATVQCAGSGQNFEPFGSPKGGQLLMQTGDARTDADGKFVLDGKSVFALFRQPGWWTALVTFSHSGYESFSTNYTGSNVTSHSGAGMPVVDAGDILLQPVAR